MRIGWGGLLGGRLRYAQPETGFRTGIEPVLLAAAIPARAGERVLEAGTGAGAASLCLIARVPGVHLTAIERDAALAALAAENARANGFAGVRIIAADLLAWRAEPPFDHAFANPPWHAEDATPSPIPRRDAAKRARAGLYADWARVLAGALRHRGTITLILPAAHTQHGLAALAGAGCGSPRITPLWPRAGVAAKLVILQAVRGGRGACELRPGLVLHDEGGAYTEEADRVLRAGEALPA